MSRKGRKPTIIKPTLEADVVSDIIIDNKTDNDIIETENKCYRVVLLGHWCSYRPNTVLNVDKKTYLELKQAGIIKE